MTRERVCFGAFAKQVEKKKREILVDDCLYRLPSGKLVYDIGTALVVNRIVNELTIKLRKLRRQLSLIEQGNIFKQIFLDDDRNEVEKEIRRLVKNLRFFEGKKKIFINQYRKKQYLLELLGARVYLCREIDALQSELDKKGKDVILNKRPVCEIIKLKKSQLSKIEEEIDDYLS